MELQSSHPGLRAQRTEDSAEAALYAQQKPHLILYEFMQADPGRSRKRKHIHRKRPSKNEKRKNIGKCRNLSEKIDVKKKKKQILNREYFKPLE